jgi:hypothetical protein
MGDYRLFGVLLLLLSVTWIFSCLGHYTGERIHSRVERWSAPGWLRKLLGDFRREGTLSVRDALVQTSCYINLLIAVFFLWNHGLTIKTTIILLALQYVLVAIIIFIVVRASRRSG